MMQIHYKGYSGLKTAKWRIKNLIFLLFQWFLYQ